MLTEQNYDYILGEQDNVSGAFDAFYSILETVGNSTIPLKKLNKK